MKYFFDTEFIEGFKKPLFGKKRHFIDLISIGIISEDGREYYAVSKEFNAKDADDWVYKNVIQNIELDWVQSYSGDGRNKMLDMIEGKGKYGAIKIMQKDIGKSNKRIAEEIKHFCNPELFLHNTAEPKLEFYGYYSDYDWVLLCSLFGRMIDLPKYFPMYCKDLKQMFDELADIYTSEQLSKIKYPNVNHNVLEFLGNNGTLDKPKYLKEHKDYPLNSNEHSALDDAKWNKKLFDFIQNRKLEFLSYKK